MNGSDGFLVPDPMYPVFYRTLSVHPWPAESPGSFRIFMSFAFPPKLGWEGVKDALLATMNFSFIPNDWWSNHRDVPVFGSLFALTLLCLPFVRARLRFWLSYLGVMAAIVVWYLTSHQDRLLQAWLPVMAAVTATTLGLVWQQRQLLVRGLPTTLPVDLPVTVQRARFLVVVPACAPNLSAEAGAEIHRLLGWDRLQLYVRKLPR